MFIFTKQTNNKKTHQQLVPSLNAPFFCTKPGVLRFPGERPGTASLREAELAMSFVKCHHTGTQQQFTYLCLNGCTNYIVSY